MTKDLTRALEEIDMTYGSVIEIANDMLEDYFHEANSLVDEITRNIHSYSIEQLRDYILQLQLQAYSLSEVKEKSMLKSDIAEAIEKEKYAEAFNGASGSNGIKDNIAIISTSEEIVARCLFNLISNMMKTKIDQLHRLVDSLKSILMSRMQEAKFMQLGSTSEIPATTNGKVVLNEKF